MDNEIVRRFNKVAHSRHVWEGLWESCFYFAQPERQCMFQPVKGEERSHRIYDGTAPDAVDVLANALLTELTPSWAPWVALEAQNYSQSQTDLGSLQEAFVDAIDSSNFAMEVHAAYVDLVVVGTSALVFDETDDGANSPFRFQVVPINELYLARTASNEPTDVFRCYQLTLAEARQKWTKLSAPSEAGDDAAVKVITSCRLVDGKWTTVVVALVAGAHHSPQELERFTSLSPSIIVFRFSRSPGEMYGRSPIMRALPDIRVINEVAHLTLANAAMDIAGVWQADDDGVLNPATVVIKPGVIVPKAMGSKGLQPLRAPGRFDVSNMIIENLAARIRRTMMVEHYIGTTPKSHVTAEEFLQRQRTDATQKGGLYGRLIQELLTPVVQRGVEILQRTGRRPDPSRARVRYLMPLARAQRAADVQNVTMWLQLLGAAGPEATALARVAEIGRYVAQALAIPASLMRDPDEAAKHLLEQTAAAVAAQAAAPTAGAPPPQEAPV